MFDSLVLGTHLPSGWLWPAMIFFGLVVFAALLVLLLVGGARFDDHPNVVPSTPVSCAPFSCATTAPAPS
ncbi:hypothetical protein [Nocardia sp. NBC_01388]|uniref:hypothetical protein n=1 Tax=Nocardia sp. NBC_01388 TaxID=2903596 RepID=UPI003249BD02